MTASPEQILRLPEVMQITGLKHSAIYKAVADGRFPKPIKLAPGVRAVGWLASEIAAHQKRCVEERDVPPKSKCKRRATR